MSVDYLIVACSEPGSAARLSAIDDVAAGSIAEVANVVGGTIRRRVIRPGVLVLTVETAPAEVAEVAELTVFDGIAVLDGRLVRSAAELGPIDAPRVARIAAEARGNFLLAHHTAEGVTLCADVLGTYPLFVFDRAGVFCASSSILLLERALERLGISLTLDLSVFAYVVTIGNGAFDLTGFREVCIASPGCVIQIGGDSRPRYTARSVRETVLSDRPQTELLDDAAQEILANLRALAAAPFTHRICDLSGGMDSRLVVAAILHDRRAGDFLFLTGGTPPNPDAIVGAMIRQQFQLRAASRPFPPAPRDLGAFDSMRHSVARSSGCFSMLYGAGGIGQPERPDILHIGGGLGETFRSFHGAPRRLRFLPSRRSAFAWVVRNITARARLILEPDALAAHLGRLEGFARDMRGVVGPADLADVFYLTNRNRYHFGSLWRVRSFARTVFQPLYSLAAIRAAYALDPRERAANRIGYELMRRLCPPLVDVPFAGTSWDASLGAPRVPPVTSASPFPTGAEPPMVTLFPPPPRPSKSKKIDAATRSTAPRAAGRSKKWVDLERALSEFSSTHESGGGFDRMSPPFDPARAGAFLHRPAASFQTERDAWTAYRLMAAYIWANRLELPPPITAPEARMSST